MRLGLRGRLVLALFATAAATLGVAALALLPPLDGRLNQDSLQFLVWHAEAGRTAVEQLRPHQSASPVMHGLARAAAAEVALVDAGGVIAESDPGLPRNLAGAQRVLRTHRGEHGITNGLATAAVPVRFRGRRVVLALQRRLGDTHRISSVVNEAFIGAALAGLALALVAGIALSGRLLRRLRALSEAMRAADPVVAPAEVDIRGDEVGELARAFAGLQQRVAQQEDARRMFVATASHELRTPLATLHALLELASAERDPEQLRMDVFDALDQTGRLTDLSRSLLDLSRLDAGMRLRCEPVELGELTRAVTAEFRLGPRLPRWIAPESPCWASADPVGVAQIVRLLVDNALRYAPPPAPVEIRTCAWNGHAAVRVLDGGAGVPPEERDAIFERFQRGGGTSGPGFGLGLAIGAELARRMSGELKLEPGDPAPGEPRGARFMLILPHA